MSPLRLFDEMTEAIARVDQLEVRVVELQRIENDCSGDEQAVMQAGVNVHTTRHNRLMAYRDLAQVCRTLVGAQCPIHGRAVTMSCPDCLSVVQATAASAHGGE